MSDRHASQALNRREFLQQVLAVSAALSLPTGSAVAGTVFQQRGNILVNGGPLDFYRSIQAGDIIETATDSSIVFSVDGDVFLLRENSRLELIGKRTFLETFRLFGGKMLAVFGKGPERKIRTNVITAGIRGTGCYVEVEENSNYFCDCYGEIALSDQHGREEILNATHHEGRRITIKNGRAIWEAAAMVGHSDAELEMLEAVVGRKPPFVG